MGTKHCGRITVSPALLKSPRNPFSRNLYSRVSIRNLFSRQVIEKGGPEDNFPLTECHEGAM